jgi:hypothetical protein
LIGLFKTGQTDYQRFATYELEIFNSFITMAPDTYQKPPQAPPRFNATPESLIADARKLNDICQNMMDHVVETVKPETATFENTILPIALDENESRLFNASYISFAADGVAKIGEE